jgi:DNA adenine methylase
MKILAQENEHVIELLNAKPFLKWAGGKTQLLHVLERRLPPAIRQNKTIDVYVEPFVGGGALFFYLKNHYKMHSAYLLDTNIDLIIAYKTVQTEPFALIEQLQKLETAYLSLPEPEREAFYYEIRAQYNAIRKTEGNWIQRAAYMIFLNKTCYNGLYRLNSNGDFNVPHGKYKQPTICDSTNILAVSKALQNTVIICADFEASRQYITKNAFVYLDPPYRPVSKTARFTQYTAHGFNDYDQLRLANYVREVTKQGAYVLLSNSDTNDGFFETLYSEFFIERVQANRPINSNAQQRKGISELLIRNYPLE